MLAIIAAYESNSAPLTSAAYEIEAGATIRTIQETAVLIDFSESIWSSFIGSDGLNNIPCSLINDGFMCIFDAYLFFLRRSNLALVLVGYDSGTAINGMTKIDFVLKNITYCSRRPFIWLINICGRTVVAYRLITMDCRLNNFFIF